MKLPVIKGLIDRRMLINFTADPEVIRAIVPTPFRPKIYAGKAIVGICLIRLKQIRPKGFPGFTGIGSENGAHRMAVEWEENGEVKEGVYIPRRDSIRNVNQLLTNSAVRCAVQFLYLMWHLLFTGFFAPPGFYLGVFI